MALLVALFTLALVYLVQRAPTQLEVLLLVLRALLVLSQVVLEPRLYLSVIRVLQVLIQLEAQSLARHALLVHMA